MTVSTDQTKTGVRTGIVTYGGSAVAVPVTGTTNETTVATVSLPALGANQAIRVTLHESYTNNANNKTVRLKLAGTTVRTSTRTTATPDTYVDLIRNRGATNSQLVSTVVVSGAASSSFTEATSSVQLGVPFDLTVTAQLAVGTDTYTMQGITVEVL